MTTQFAKENISIEDYLSWKGYLSERSCGGRLYYSSPFRNGRESHPSLSVNTVDKRWRDWGLDGSDGRPFQGSIVDLAYRFCGSLEAGLKELDMFYGNFETVTHVKTYPCESKHDIKLSQGIVILNDSLVQMRALLAYAKSRCIERQVLDEYCREVWYKNGADSKARFSLGIKNVEGGWELSSQGFKCSTSPKAYSFFGKGSDEVLVFEGMFDMLSWIMFAKFIYKPIKRDIICLNSVVNVEKTLPKLLEYNKVHLFLDNDSAGSRATTCIADSCRDVKDYRSWYTKYKDVNEAWCKSLEHSGLELPLIPRSGGKSSGYYDYLK